MGLRFLDAEKAATVVDGLRIETVTAAAGDDERERHLAVALATGAVIPPEAANITQTSYERPGGIALVRRTEALLVTAYRATLGNADVGRIRTPSGVTDLWVRSSLGTEIVEAKRNADHDLIRHALGQLLDYVRHAPEPVDRLSVLVPKRPSSADVHLLHQYGVDVLHLEDEGHFVRLPAENTQRLRMRAIWSSS